MTVGDLADPDVFQDTDGTYYAYGTTMGGRNVPLITSKDLTNWTTNKAYKPTKSSTGRFPQNGNDTYYNDTLALPGTWAYKHCSSNSDGCYEIWAPSVEKAGNGKYVTAYAARLNGQTNKFAIGIATSNSPTGPFYDDSSQPFVTSGDPNGVIDPDLYKDPSTGKLYLYWKNEGNSADPSNRTRIHVRELNATTGTSWAAGSNENGSLLNVDPIKDNTRSHWGESWANPVIENPSMVKYNGQYYLFFSGNQYGSGKCAVGYAKCSTPTSGCVATSTPILQTDTALGLIGPGGANAFVTKNNQLKFAYAAWTRAGHTNYNSTNDVKSAYWDGGTAGVADQRFFRIASVGSYGTNKMLAVTQKASNLVNPAFTVSNVSSNKAKTFTDYTSNDQFAAEMNWLGATGITTGYSDGTYHPLEAINRNAMAAYLYRMAGSPSFTAPAVSPFTDVHPGDPFYKEITWMRSVGITTGYGDGSFHPYEKIHRDAMATFLYRMAGRPAYSAPSTSAFTDIKPGDQFYKEVSWAASQGITTGWSVNGGKAFRPLNNINRDAMAAFVYRMASKGWVVAY